MVEPGDYSGPAGARAVLEAPGVEVGILETARGGMLLRGMGVTHNDVSVVTNVSRRPPGHAGHRHRRPARRGQGHRHPRHAAEGLGRAQRRGPAGLGDAHRHPGPPVGVLLPTPARRPCARRSPPAAAPRPCSTAHVTVLSADGTPDRLLRVVDLPMALSGLSHHNVLNALAGASAALGPRHRPRRRRRGAAHVPPRRRPQPRPDEHLLAAPSRAARSPSSSTSRTTRPGSRRCSTWRAGSAAPGGRLHLGARHRRRPHRRHPPALGEIAGVRADHVVAAHKEHYLRGRTTDGPRGPAADRPGHGPVSPTSRPTRPSSPACRPSSRWPSDGDVVAVMCHAERAEIVAWLRGRGGGGRRPRRHPPQGGRGRAASTRPRTRSPRSGRSRMPRSGAERRQGSYAAHAGDARITYE